MLNGLRMRAGNFSDGFSWMISKSENYVCVLLLSERIKADFNIRKIRKSEMSPLSLKIETLNF